MSRHFLSRHSLIRFALLATLGTLSGCESVVRIGPADAEGTSRSIVLTDVDFDPDSKIPENQPMADYLSAKLKRQGVSDGSVQIAPDIETLMAWMKAGEVNLYFDSVYPAMQVIEATGAIPVLRRWKDGVAEYSTYFVVREDSGIESIEDLQGQMMAMQSPTSSSGFMFPMLSMLDAGLSPTEKLEANHSVGGDEVGYIFSGQDENTVSWLLEGKVSAGAMDNETWIELSDSDRAQLKIIAETDKFPRQVVVVGPGLSDKQVDALKSVMVDMDESRKGREVLVEFKETAQFDEFPNGADAEIARLKTAFDRLQAHLNATVQNDPSDEPSDN